MKQIENFIDWFFKVQDGVFIHRLEGLSIEETYYRTSGYILNLVIDLNDRQLYFFLILGGGIDHIGSLI